MGWFDEDEEDKMNMNERRRRIEKEEGEEGEGLVTYLSWFKYSVATSTALLFRSMRSF